MSSNTPNLGLLKKDPMLDGNETFNIKTMLNDNWDKIDEAVGQVREDLGNVNIPDASLTVKGKVQLSNATDGIRENVAATEKAVKAAYDETVEYVDNKSANAVTYTTKNEFWYVDSVNGNDNNTGKSKVQAFKTVEKAVRSIPNVVNHQFNIRLLPGTYGVVHISDKAGSGGISLGSENSNPSEVIVKSVTFSRVKVAEYLRVRDISVEEKVFFHNTTYGDVYNVITSGTNREGIEASYFSNIEVTKCVISNKSLAIEAAYGGRIFAMDNSGQNNSTAFSTRYGGIIHKTGTYPSAKSTQSSYEGGVIFG